MTVVPTGDAIEMLHPKHKIPTRRQIDQYAGILQKQGMIEPLAAIGGVIRDMFAVGFLYAAVELGWDTVIIDTEGTTSG